MRRLVLVAVLAAAAPLAGCGRSSKPGGAVTPATPGSVTVPDPRGDAVDAGGNRRRGRPDVDGYDLVNVLRKGTELGGYFAFENSAARQALTEPQSLTAKGPTVAINVSVDPIFGATPFQWRVSVAAAAGAPISDTLPSPTGLRTFPPPRG